MKVSMKLSASICALFHLTLVRVKYLQTEINTVRKRTLGLLFSGFC